MEAVRCLHNTGPFSASLTESKGMQGNTFGIRLAAGVSGRKLPLTSSHLKDSTLDLYSGFTSIPFSMNGYNREAADYRYLYNPWMGPLTGITTQGQSRPGSNDNLKELHLPQTLELPNLSLAGGCSLTSCPGHTHI